MRRWRLTITEGTEARTVAETVVEASHWLGALEAGQRALGEPAGVPRGASCAVAPDERVTLHDARTQRTLHLAPEGAAAAPRAVAPPQPAAPPPPPPQAPAPPGPGPGVPAATARRSAARTVAFDLGSMPPLAPPAKPAAAAKRTMAYNIADLDLQRVREVVVGQPPPAPPAPPGPEHGAVLSARDAEPSAESPLRYRERTYFVRPGTSETDALALLRGRLAALQRELAQAPPGKYVNLAAFDHPWTDTPTRPPLVTIQWMDWRGAPEIAFPARTSR